MSDRLREIEERWAKLAERSEDFEYVLDELKFVTRARVAAMAELTVVRRACSDANRRVDATEKERDRYGAMSTEQHEIWMSEASRADAAEKALGQMKDWADRLERELNEAAALLGCNPHYVAEYVTIERNESKESARVRNEAIKSNQEMARQLNESQKIAALWKADFDRVSLERAALAKQLRDIGHGSTALEHVVRRTGKAEQWKQVQSEV